MISDTSYDDSWASRARLFLDVPYRLGYRHIQLACSSNHKITDIALEKTTIGIEPEPLTLKERAKHLALGIGECIPLVGVVVSFVDRYLHRERYVDEFQLIKGNRPIKEYQRVWHLNHALLKNAYTKATGRQKEQIQFLAANFLNKVTPKRLDLSSDQVAALHQGSPIEEFRYHREVLDQKLAFGSAFNQKLAYGNSSLFLLTDTSEVEQVFPLRFTVINEKVDPASLIKETLRNHISKQSEKPLDHPLPLPLLVDCTNILRKNIETNGDKKAEKEFKDAFEQYKRGFYAAVDGAINDLARENPQFSKRELKKYIFDNTTCISRVTMKGASGIKMLPLGSLQTKEAQFTSPLINFMIRTGLYIGAIGLRKLTSDVFLQRPDISYAVTKGPDKAVRYFQSTEDFTRTQLMQRLSSYFGSATTKPHIAVLGKATIDLVKGLMSEIEKKRWEELHADPITADIVQTALFMINQHFAAAELSAARNDFGQFSQEIELVHAQLSMLLELARPFGEQDFSGIYKDALVGRVVPGPLADMVKAGLGKTAVNIFAGIAAAAKEEAAPLRAISCEGAYFEQAAFVDRGFTEFMSDSARPQVDLYLTQFSPNIDVGADLRHYSRRDVAADVERLLAEKRSSDNFTVAVDCTIDKFYSENVKELLTKFKDEIASGKVNFVFFSSGQKFSTLGMDDYYGATFYMANNGDAKWKKYDSLFTQPVHRTDPLSTQWFCLSTKYAADSLNKYRELIFTNTRAILDRVPEALRPQANAGQRVRVNSADQKMDACFIDMKVLGNFLYQKLKSNRIQDLYHRIMAKHGIKTFGRGSFGFFLQNFAVFGPMDKDARAIRINPGINPEDNEAVVEFMQAISDMELGYATQF